MEAETITYRLAHATEAQPSRQVEIPPTTPERYITGIYALSVQAPEGTSGYWHDVFHWQEGRDRPPQVTLSGSTEIDTSPIYGSYGIYQGRQRLESMGLILPQTGEVYFANHTRAILDLLYRLPDSLGPSLQPDWRQYRLARHLRPRHLPARADRKASTPLPPHCAG